MRLVLLLLLMLAPAPLSAESGALGPAFHWIQDGPVLPDYVFHEDGTKDTGFIEFRGQPLVVTFWATWCGVCAKEVPKLDRLQAALGDRLTVIALSQDKGGAEVVRRYFEKRGIRNLRVFIDTNRVLGSALGIRGVPTSFLVDASGRMLGAAEGPADWDAPGARRLLEGLLAPPTDRT